MTWLEKLIDAFEQIPEVEVKYARLYAYFVDRYGDELPVSYKNVIQRMIQNNSRDSQRDAPDNDKKPHIFSAPRGLGKGIWMLNSKVSTTAAAPDMGEVVDHEATKRVGVEIFRVMRDTRLSKSLKAIHFHRCQVCGLSVSFGEFSYSEAHHIQPLGRPHNGPDSFDNLLVLCPNHHVEFDYGLMAVDMDLRIIHKDGGNPFVGQLLRLDTEHPINRKFLSYHLNSIFNKSNLNEGV